MAKKITGIVLYRGPSMLDGKPIVAIATAMDKASRNTKTGAMVQTYILREDIHPVEAAQTGEDSSICGDCRHRGQVVDGKNINRSCYVTLIHGPRNVWASYQRGTVYEDGVRFNMEDLEREFSDKVVRLGTYGDPAAVPVAVWHTITRSARKSTGYTHQWRKFPELASLCMASCDSEQDRVHAKFLGFRTFRVRRESDPVLTGEGKCPASAEMGKRTNCFACHLCSGNAPKAPKADIVIIAHGTPGRNFERMAA